MAETRLNEGLLDSDEINSDDPDTAFHVIAVRKSTHVTIPEGPARRYSLRIHHPLMRELMHATSSPPLSLYLITFLLSAYLLRLPDSQLLRLELVNHRDARLNGSHLSQRTAARSLCPRYQRSRLSRIPHTPSLVRPTRTYSA